MKFRPHKQRKYGIKFDPSTSMTKQSFRDECDINKIMAKFQRTGAIDHFAKHAPQYGDATAIELQDALNVVANANTMFEELPATIRKKFENDPQQFLDFVQDEGNAAEMIELGLRDDNRAQVRDNVRQRSTDSSPSPDVGKADSESADA
ncbi:internal scaffolding protein [Microviridae sp.]|nr:internal scaffolding protein [Microviridae sp.]